MQGELFEKKDYDLNNHKMRITMQNTYFNEKYGRTDFEEIAKPEIARTVKYIAKYISKTNARIVYSKGLPAYIVSDILEEDVLCTTGIDNRKFILPDNFTCIDNGEIIGQASPEIIAKMPKCN